MVYWKSLIGKSDVEDLIKYSGLSKREQQEFINKIKWEIWMSVVAVKKEANKIKVASDNMVTYYGGSYQRIHDGCKLFKANDELYIGGAGNLKDLNLLRLYCNNHLLTPGSEKDILEFFSDFNIWAKKYDNNFDFDSSLILVVGNEIYNFAGWCLIPINDYCAVGSGGQCALTSLYLGKTAKESVKIAIELDPYCGGDILEYEIKI